MALQERILLEIAALRAGLEAFLAELGCPPADIIRSMSQEEFQAQALFCGRCRAAQPVRERLLLLLPDGELREYLCARCGASVGQRRVTAERPVLIAG